MQSRRWLALLVHPRDVLVDSPSAKNVIRLAARTGALDLVQLRSTQRDLENEVFSAGKILGEWVDEYRRADEPKVRLIVNHESLETALALRADGWHWKERMMERPLMDVQRDVEEAKRRELLLGCSVHKVDAAVVAAKCGFDYVQVGTMFSTPSHPEKSEAALLEGPALLLNIRRAMYSSSQRPLTYPQLIAVGGINTSEHVQQVVRAGAEGVAVFRGILAHQHPDEAARSYRTWLDLPRARSDSKNSNA